MMEVAVVILMLAVACAFFAPVIIAILEEGHNPFAPFARLGGWWQSRKERHLPVWERLVRAEERAGEEALRDGDLSVARRHFREAQRIRDAAMQDLLNGEEPKL